MSRLNLLEALTDNIVIDPAKCIFCGECVEVCVLDNLRMKLAPCRAACPLGVNCQGYVQLVNRGEDAKALAELMKVLPFPGTLSRVCTAPCENACHRKERTGEAVSIRGIKRYLADLDDFIERPLPEMAEASGQSVAIIGSGPAGMMATYDLRRKGHAVTVIEAEREAGGMLRWAIPAFNLPAKVVAAEIESLQQMGASFQLGTRVGKDLTLEEIKDRHDAVIVAVGCGGHLKLNLEGEDLGGVYHGLPFLRDVRAGKPPQMGGKVVVIGGGNAAVDAARTALRLGADSVTLVSLENEDELPAFAETVDIAREEGVVLEHSWGTLEIAGKNGKAVAVRLQRCLCVFDGEGKFNPSFDACQIMDLPADQVIVAIGQRRDASCLEGMGIEPAEADPVTKATSDEKVFLAGDFIGGPSSIIEAMASGRAAAESVDLFLKGEHLKYGRSYPGPIELEFEIDESRGSGLSRIKPKHKICKGKGDFKETAAAMTTKQARDEASRCYSCGSPFGKYRTCWFCLPCEVECPEQALYVEIPYLLR